jgi:hypothetical protein
MAKALLLQSAVFIVFPAGLSPGPAHSEKNPQIQLLFIYSKNVHQPATAFHLREKVSVRRGRP